MGWHWFLDTASGGRLPTRAENTFPVVTMYHENQLNAIFFTSWSNEVTVPFVDSNEWEPIALTVPLMCKNACAKTCASENFQGTEKWSTMHVYFRDHREVKCTGDLECALYVPSKWGCCER